jgi:type VI secretion system protein ImpH
MAAYGRTASGSVAGQLQAQGQRFDFYQAVRLLELLHETGAVALGETATPGQEAVRFSSEVSLSFPATDVARVEPDPLLFVLDAPLSAGLDQALMPEPLVRAFRQHNVHLTQHYARVQGDAASGQWIIVDAAHQHVYHVVREGGQLYVYAGQAAMAVNFLGLAGVHGPLPTPITTTLLDRLREGDAILRDFLDIFNHRLVSLMYRVRKLHRVGMLNARPGSEQDRFAGFLYALMGLGTPGLRGRLPLDDRVLLRYAGLLAHQVRSAAGLECMLSDYFGIEVRVQQFQGRWLRLDAAQRTAIGVVEGRHQALGLDFTLGGRVYEAQTRFELKLGPLDLGRFRDFLPTGQGHRVLKALTRFYVRDALDFDLRLTLRGEQVPEWRLGVEQGNRLGWTTWLKTLPFEGDDSQVRVGGDWWQG